MRSVIDTRFWIGFFCGLVLGPFILFSFMKKVGKAPGIDFSRLVLSDLNGNLIEMPKGPLILNFWGTWSEPCIKELGMLNNIYKEAIPKGIGVVAISDEPLEIIGEFRKEHGLSLPMYRSEIKLKSLGMEGIPVTYLLDENGMTLYSRVGVLRPKSPRFVKAMKKLSGE